MVTAETEIPSVNETSIEASTANVADPVALKAAANACYKTKDYTGAIEFYSQAIAVDGENSTLYSNRAAANLMLSRYRQAADDSRSCLSLDPTSSKAVLRLVKSLVHLGNLSDAKNVLADSTTAGIQSPEIFQYSGTVDSLINMEERVQIAHRAEAWEEVIKWTTRMQEKLDTDAHLPLPWALAAAEAYSVGRKDFTTADSLLRNILAQDPSNAEAMFIRAKLFAHQGDTTKAIAHCQESLRRDPDFQKVRVYLKIVRELEKLRTTGNDFFKKGDMQSALDMYTQALKVDESNTAIKAKLLSNRAIALSKLGKFDMALTDCESCLAIDPDFVKVHRRKGDTLLKLERYEEAVASYQKAVELEPETKEIKQELRQAELELKKSKRQDHYKILGVEKSADESAIKKAYRKMALQYHPDKNPDDPEAEHQFKKVGEAYATLGDPEKKRRYDSGQDLDDGMGGGGFSGGMDQEALFEMLFQHHGFGGGAGGSKRSSRHSHHSHRHAF